MKRALIFIGLKVVEIGGFAFLPYCVGLLGRNIGLLDAFGDTFAHVWIKGALYVMLLYVLLIAIVAIAALMVKNWQWAGRLSERLRNRTSPRQ